MDMVGHEHRVVIDCGKHVREKYILAGSAALVHHGLQSGVIDDDVRGVRAVIQHGILQTGYLGDDNVCVGHIGENQIEQVGHVVGGDDVWVSSASDVICSNHQHHHVRSVGCNEHGVGDDFEKVRIGCAVAVDRKNAGGRDDRPAVTFVVRLVERPNRAGDLAAGEREWKTVGFEHWLQI